MDTGPHAADAPIGRVALGVLWLLVSTAWLVAWFVPWTSRGLLSTSSLADGARLIRDGSVSALIPSWVGWLLLIGPACGLLVLATFPRVGPVAVSARTLSVASMVAVFVACFHSVAQFDPARLGPGGWLTVGAVVLGLAGLALHRRLPRTHIEEDD